MESKSFERRDQLIEAALDEFTKRSYDDASLNSIIKSAGISKGTFYYHFENKEALYLYLLEHSVAEKWKYIEKRTKEMGQDDVGMGIFDMFKFQARLGTEFGKLHPRYHQLSIMFSKEKGKEIFDKASDILGTDSDEMLREMIKEAIENGELRNDLPKEFVINMVTYLFKHYTDVFKQEEDLTIEKMIDNVDNFVDFMSNGIGSKLNRR
jgi:AcrR family transcriptional regulator